MHSLAQLCVKRPVFATMLILSLVVVGIFSYFGLGVDLFPKVDIPTVAVIIANPGASPEEVETEITKKVEDAVNTISMVDEVRSTSSEGQSLVLITFELAKNGDVAAQEVQNKVNVIVNNLPDTAKEPIVQKFDPDAAPILQIAVSAQRSLRDVTLIADRQIKQKLENAKGVGQITIVGGARREMHVMVDPERLRAYNLTVTDVFNAVRAQNMELPGGSLNAGAKEFTVRTTGRVPDAAQFNQITVANRNGYIVKVADIGFAEDAYEEPRTAARLDGVPAVTLIVAKQSGMNTVETATEVKQRLKEIGATLPKDVKTQVISDQSVFIEAAVNNIKKHLIEGSIFAAIIIFLFLSNIRTTLIAAVAIPTSIISTFALMAAMGFTLNQITMLALTLMVGIVIDDAIIVLENIFRFIEEKHMPPFQAAIQGTREIGLAVMATTLSLLAVFLPVGFMGGIVGRFMSSFGFTSAFAIAVSLLVSFTLTPMLTSRFVKPPKPGEKHSSKESFVFRHLDNWYTKMLVWSMHHRKAVVAISILVVMSIVPLFMGVGKNFLPKDDQAQYNVLIRTPEGTSLAATTSVTERIAQDIRKLPGVIHTLATVGGGADRSVNNAAVYVKLSDIERRELSQHDLMQKTRDLLKDIPPEIHTGVELISNVGGNQSNAEIQYFVQGPDLQKLAQYSETLLAKMKAMPGLVDADSTLRSGKPEIRLEIDRPRAADLGVSVLDIQMALNTLVAGQVASTFNAGEDQYDVRVRAQEQYRGGAEGIAKMTVPSVKLGSVPLDQVARISSGSGPSSINRINRQRQVTLTGNVLPGGSQSDILAKLDEFRNEAKMDPEYRSGLAGASKELGRAGFYFMLAFALTFIFMYIVLAAQFESFIHPITILITLPLAVPFGIVSLLLAGQTVNIFSGLGLLLLFGIVKKNAILQIDHTNGLRAQGMKRYDAIIQANRDRLRPILMTTIALVAGMAPLVMSSGVGSATNRSIGVLVVGGQTLCLLLTLLAVPVFYSLFEDLGGFAKKIVPKRRPKLEEVAAGLVVLALLFAPAPAVAETAPPARIGIIGEARLPLAEAIERVLKSDPDLRISRIEKEQAGFQIKAAQGAYDPVLGFNAYRTKAVSPVASILAGTPSGKLSQTDFNLTPNVSGLTPWGGTYNFRFSNARQQTDNLFATLNPQYPTTASLNLTQPLWRGLRFDPNRHRIEVARAGERLSTAQLRRRVIERVTAAVNAYWELDFAWSNYQVQLEAVRLAEQQLESNRRQVEQGVLAPVDVTAAQTQVATFQQNLYLAQQALTAAENNLKMLMLPDRADLMWSAALIPETRPDTSPSVVPLRDAVNQALSSRPEVTQNGLALDINQLDVRLAKDQAKPQINAYANLSATGLSGTALPNAGTLPISLPISLTPPEFFVGGYGQSLGNLFGGNFPTAQVGVQISLPLRNRTAEAQVATTQAEGRKLKAQRDQIGMAIEADVRNALQASVSAQARLGAATLARQSAEEQYASEQRQMQAGTSTVFLVLQRQTEFIAARSREARARTDVAEAKANLDRAMGATIQAQGINVTF